MEVKIIQMRQNDILKRIVAILLLIVLTMADFALVGIETVSYAANLLNVGVATNNKNVTFDSYFKAANGENVTSKEDSIASSDIKLYVQVSVKNDGYFNGAITLGNSNFKIKNEILSNAINKIEGNTVTLNQINSGEVVEVELGIEPVKEDTINSGLLSMLTDVSINGIYRNSEERDITITATRQVQLILSSPYAENEGAELTTKVLTNGVYEIDKTKKRIVQILVESGIRDNLYPVKEDSIELSVPSEVERVEVNSRGVLACNGKYETEFSKDNWTYNEDEKKVYITIKNDEKDGKINWIKSGKDSMVVTYVLKENAIVKDADVNSKNKITLYDTNSTTKEALSTVKIQEDIDGIITYGLETEETSFYKGKIYSGENRDYKLNTKIYVNNSETDKEIKLDLSQAMYETTEAQVPANAQYVNTIISKKDVQRVLGEDGELTISTVEGTIISKISKNTQADENDNVVITYPEGIKALKIETTKTKQAGTIELKHSKTIKEDGNTRAIKETYTSLKESVMDKNTTIELKATKTTAKLSINKAKLSTLTENTGVELTAVLQTNSEEYDLYANPNIKLELPNQVENVTINSINLFYEDELHIASASIDDENGRKVINVNLAGEQTKHKIGALEEGATVIINANMSLNKKATNSDEAIKMTYTNQTTNAVLNIEQPIQVVSPRGIITINNIEDYGISSIGEEETKTAKLELGTDAKQSQVNIEVINNNDETVKDVKVLGEFPTKSDTNTIETSVSGLDISSEKAIVYYSENEKATEDLQDASNKWSREILDNTKVKKYLITVDSMEQSEGLIASYRLAIPQGLQYNEQVSEGYKVLYNDTNTSNEAVATTLTLSTGKGPELKTKLNAKLGSTEIANGTEITQGEIVKYEITIENTGSETATNINVSALVPEGTIYVEPKADFIYEDGYYNEIADKKEVNYSIESIAAGEKVIKSYEVKVTKNIEANSELVNKATTKFGEAKSESETLKNKVNAGNLSIFVKRATDLGVKTYRNEYIDYFVSVENISNQILRDVTVNINIPEELEVQKVFKLTDNGKEEIESYKNIKINQIDAGKLSNLYIVTKIKTLNNQESKEVYISATAKEGNSKEVKSNEFKENLKDFKLNISLSANNENGYIKSNDIVEYTIKIENVSNIDSTAVNITDTIPQQLSIQSVTVNDEPIENNSNNFMILKSIPANSTLEAKVKAIVNYDETRTEPITISNVATVLNATETLAESDEVTHIIQADSSLNGQASGSSTSNKNLISGTAWLDENKDGQKDSNEKLLNGINVKLIDTEGNIIKDSNGNDIQATTNNNGFYMLSNIPQGEYLVAFDYDTSLYVVTAYHKDGVANSRNSDAISKQITVNGEQRVFGVTDTIAINENGVSNINIGLMTSTKFDLELNKYISKIVVQTSAETKTYTYDKATLAKAEIAAKQLKGTNVIIEYQIDVTNTGDVAGYVKNIVDYKPSTLKFSSELNTSWYESENNLYNKSLANTKLEPGETKTIALTLTKAMTEENTGLVNNTAEIGESYNEYGIADIDSTAGNKVKGEDDMGAADVIIGVKTGAMVTYIGLIIAILIVAGLAGYLVYRGVDKKHKIEDLI